jgi:hypothetical protein
MRSMLVLVCASLTSCAPVVPASHFPEASPRALDEPGPLRVTHRALVDGRWQTRDDAAWQDGGEREALLDYAARRLGCRAADLRAQRPHHLWIVEGCSNGVFASVAQWLRSGPARTQVLASEFFVDVANEDPAAAWEAMQRAVPGGDGEWLVDGDGGEVARELGRLVAINAAGAHDLACPRSRVSHDHVRLRGTTLTIVEGCGRRATYLDTDPRVWRLVAVAAVAEMPLRTP